MKLGNRNENWECVSMYKGLTLVRC